MSIFGFNTNNNPFSEKNNPFVYAEEGLTMTTQERADRFAEFVGAVTNYHSQFESVMEQIKTAHSSPNDEALEMFRQSVPVVNLEAIKDNALRDGVLVWSLNQAKKDPEIIKSVGAVLLRPVDDDDNSVSTQAKATATDMVCLLLMAGGAFAPAFPLIANNRVRMLIGNLDTTHLHEIVTEAIFLGSVNENNTSSAVIEAIQSADCDILWNMFSVNLDESAMWAELDKETKND